MSAANHHGPGDDVPAIQGHYGLLRQQMHAARLGMWMFLATEILLFGGLFAAYIVYRSVHPAAFEAASHHLNVTLGTINTLVLITSSFTVVVAIWAAEHEKRKLTVAALVITIVCAAIFLLIKYFEYREKFMEGALPGKYYHFHEINLPGAAIYYTCYFLMTGLHGIHVTVGMVVLGWLAVHYARGKDAGYHMKLELGGLYWHLVDVIWIFLYPLLYLIT